MPHTHIRDVKGKIIEVWQEDHSSVKVGMLLQIKSVPHRVTGVAKVNRHTEVNVEPIKVSK